MQSILFLLRHWQQRFALVFLIALTTAIMAVADVCLPYFIGQLVDAFAANAADRSAMWRDGGGLIAMIVVVGAVTIVARYISYRTMSVLTPGIMTRVAHDTFSRIQRFSIDWHIASFSGSVTRKIGRGMWAVDTLNDVLLLSFWPTFLLLSSFCGMLIWQWPLVGALSLFGIVVYCALSVLTQIYFVMPLAAEANRWDSKVSGTIGDALVGQAAVKAFASEAHEEKGLFKALAAWKHYMRLSWLRYVLNMTLQEVWLMVLRVTVMLILIDAWVKGAASAGNVVFVLTGYGLIDAHLRDLGHYVRMMQRGVNELEELVGMVQQEPAIVDVSNAPALQICRGEIRFDQVGFSYALPAPPGGVRAGMKSPMVAKRAVYTGLSLKIAGGEHVGLVGHSGSGKSTLIKMLQRLYEVDSGTILIDGQSIGAVSLSSLRRAIAVVPQDPMLFHRSIAENIAYGCHDASPAQIRAAAREACADEFISALPLGYDTLVGERGVRLSGGERQRIALARAFLADARIVVFDEATASLDNASEALVQKAMARLMAGRTTLTIAHRLSTVRRMDRILVFADGGVAEEGTHAALMAIEGGVYRQLVRAGESREVAAGETATGALV